MNAFDYSDEAISERELMIALPSIMIGVSILSLPSQLAQVTSGSDGWVSIIISGIIIGLFSWLGAKLATQFPEQSFFSYTTTLVTKPIALMFLFIFVIIAISVASYVLRKFSDVVGIFLFNQTPSHVLALTLILIVVYAVSGTRAGIFRLNVLFLPIIVFIIITTIIFNMKWIELDNFLPLFQTNLKDYIRATAYNTGSYVGFGIILFYVFLVHKPKNIPRITLYGVGISTALYTIVFLTTIGIFGNLATADLLYPTIGLAKRVEFPGGIVERLESVFFVVWTMGIFNTIVIALDSSVLLLQSIFKRVKKIKLLFFLAPITYYLSMLPQDYLQVEQLSNYVGMFAIPFTFSVIITLLTVAWLKGVFRNE